MSEHEKFYGRVDRVIGGVAYLTIDMGGSLLYGEYEYAKLLESGIKSGDRFSCRVADDDIRIVFENEPFVEVVDEEYRKIDESLSFMSDDCKDDFALVVDRVNARTPQETAAILVDIGIVDGSGKLAEKYRRCDDVDSEGEEPTGGDSTNSN